MLLQPKGFLKAWRTIPNRPGILAILSYFCQFKLLQMDTVVMNPVILTERAIVEVKRLRERDGFDTSQFLRIGVKGGGCSGLSYVLGFDSKREGDEVYDIDGLQYIMNASHGLYLMGMEVDWQEGLNARGFVFSNPNASKSCGCGTSFAV
jgi:iron-sulfur cluster assembly accessory protein